LVRGFVSSERGAYAVYLARWSEGHPESGVEMLVSFGNWGEGSDASSRKAVLLEWQPLENGPGCRVLDARNTTWAREESFYGCMLSREAALESSISSQAFEIADAVYEKDARFREFIQGTGR